MVPPRAVPLRKRALPLGRLLRHGGERGLHADAVHVRVQRQLRRSLQPLPPARRLRAAHDLRRAAGQRAPAHGAERYAGNWWASSGSGKSSGRLSAAITATAYVLPAGQSLTGEDFRRPSRHGDADGFHRSFELRQSPAVVAGDPMNDFVNSLKSDLLDRRFLPVLALLGVALIAALAYAVLGAGRPRRARHRLRAPPPSSSSSSGVTKATGVVAISQAPADTAKQADRRDDDSASKQLPARSRDPFTPLPEAKKVRLRHRSWPRAPRAAISARAPGSGKSTSSSGGQPAPTPFEPMASTAKKKSSCHLHVTAQFGVLPTPSRGNASAQPAQLKRPSRGCPLDDPLFPPTEPQLVDCQSTRSATAEDAAYALTGEAGMLHGAATLPTQSPSAGTRRSFSQPEQSENARSRSARPANETRPSN